MPLYKKNKNNNDSSTKLKKKILVSLQHSIISDGEANYDNNVDILDPPLLGGEDDDGSGDNIPGLLASLPHLLYHGQPLSSH